MRRRAFTASIAAIAAGGPLGEPISLTTRTATRRYPSMHDLSAEVTVALEAAG